MGGQEDLILHFPDPIIASPHIFRRSREGHDLFDLTIFQPHLVQIAPHPGIGRHKKEMIAFLIKGVKHQMISILLLVLHDLPSREHHRLPQHPKVMDQR